jgi:4-diphosphocytidyl-2-C-methyl-D-erythritol kinase
MAEVVLRALRRQARITIEIKKKLPPQGGLGAASANAASTLVAVERLLEGRLTPDHRLRLAEEIGSDVPLFLVGGTVLGLGHGEQVAPLPDLPPLACVVALPKVGVSTPRAFHEWDRLTASRPSDKMSKLSQWIGFWLAGPYSGVSTRGGNRAEALLLDLVRAGVENDFEKVVFPQHPELRKVKRVLLGAGAPVASLSGSGSALFGLFASRPRALAAAKKLKKMGVPAQVTVTMDRATYWKKIFRK